MSLLAACGEPSVQPEATAPSSTVTDAGSTVTDGAIEPVHMDLFVMSKCPYGVRAEQAILPVANKLGPALDLHIEYIGQGSAGSLDSMHGASEVTGDLAQVCTRELSPEHFQDMIACLNEHTRTIDTSWGDCADQLGVDHAALTACIEGDQGQQLLAASFAVAAERGAHGSPTIFVNGEPYRGTRSETGFLRGLCAHWDEGSKPAACAELPPVVEVQAIFLSDRRCAECDLHPVEGKLSGALAGLNVRYLDMADPEGRELYDRLHASTPEFTYLPAVLLDPAVEQDAEGYPQIERYLRPVGEFKELRMGGKFDPYAEICDNHIDDDGNGAVDCADDGCSNKLVCREAVPQKLDLFVMSQCPYGARALIAVNDVKQTFGDEMNVEVHYIGSVTPQGLSSMHGPAEVDFDLREICAAHVAPDRSLPFAACISRDPRNADWEACATETGIPSSAIQSCVDGEGPALLQASFEGSTALGIGSSPTYLFNNTRNARAGDAASIQREFCRDNPGLSACGAHVDATSTEPVPAGACAN